VFLGSRDKPSPLQFPKSSLSMYTRCQVGARRGVLQNPSDEIYKRFTVITVNLSVLVCLWIAVINGDPQSTLNPFRPPRRTVLALAVSTSPTLESVAMVSPSSTPTFPPTSAPTLTPTASPTIVTPTDAPTGTPYISPFPTSTNFPAYPTAIPRVVPPTPKPTLEAQISGKWIDVDIGDQTITAYSGDTLLKKVLVSTGVASHPTVVGRFAIYQKLESQDMSGGNRFSGDYYFLPGVPSVMYFYAGYAIHGTYWHHNFGHPMSHGCVNLSKEDAKWFFNWAEVGTPVITHY
jgi:lipoprotein-anchoring transpeptidase ErfK/SrfK